MIDRIRNHRLSQALLRGTEWARGWAIPGLLQRRTFRAAFIASVLAIVYWGFIASDRYVSEAHVVIQRADLAASTALDFGTLLAGAASGNSKTDQLLLREYLLSTDMLQKLDAALDLRKHYSDPRHDLLSRMWGKNASQERFHDYFLSRVEVQYDDYSGVLNIRVQAYDPDTAHKLGTLLVAEGERYMNELAHRLAEEQVRFLEKQVGQMSDRALKARQTVVTYQNAKGLVAPESLAESLNAVINGLESKLAELRARRTVLLGYLAPTAPGVVEVDLQIGALQKQIGEEQKRLASPNGKPLNRTVEEYQRLELAAEFAMESYRSALVALEQGRLEATRTLKKVSVLQSATLPEYAREPRRVYHIIVFILAALLIAGIVHLLAAVIRDHKD